MYIDTRLTEDTITFEINFSEEDFDLAKEELNKKLQKWSKMLSNALEIINISFYPLYVYDNTLVYLYGYIDTLKNNEFNTTYFGYIQELYNKAKDVSRC